MHENDDRKRTEDARQSKSLDTVCVVEVFLASLFGTVKKGDF